MAWTVAGRSKPLSSGPHAGAELILMAEEAVDTANKVFDFTDDLVSFAPNAVAAEVLWFFMDYTAEAGGTGRQPFVQIRDVENDTVGGVGVESTIAAAQNVPIMIGAHLEQNAAITPDHARLPEHLMMLPGMNMLIGDLNVQNANDDNILHIMFAVYS